MSDSSDEREKPPAPTVSDGEPTAELAEAETPQSTWASSAWDPIFTGGTLVAGRYLIIRFLAGGGAGEVFEAEDQELGGRVALKAIRHALSDDPRRFERFRREIHLARKVTHPNVCRIYDAGHHVRAVPGAAPESAPADIFFITMELLDGESLATRLAMDGRLAPAVALPILRQIAEGLDAAHAAGVIHRDLKCANVMLVPAADDRPGSAAGVRAVVTDFGLARLRENDEDSSSTGVTLSGVILGTPSYMAPEQVEGGEITAATDVYSFGVMMFEMATGELPFEGGTALSVALKRLQEEPPSPREVWPSLDARWDRVIRRCMGRRPADRFPSPGIAVRALTDEATDFMPGLGSAPRRRLTAWLAAALVVVAGLASWSWYASHRGRMAEIAGGAPDTPPVAGAAVARPAPARKAVAVLGFRNTSGRPADAWLSTAFAEMLSTELAAGERVRAVPGETVARVKLELALPDVDSLALDTLHKIRASLGSDYVLLGSYVSSPRSAGSVLRLDYRLQDTSTGESVLLQKEAPQEELFNLVAQAGAALRERLGVGALDKTTVDAVQASRPANGEAARFYAQGLSRLRLYDALGAREALEQAIAADPAFPLAHAALAEAWTRLGYEKNAAEEAQLAARTSANLPREERLWIEARAREAAKDAAGAVELYRELVRLFPDDPEYSLRLAGSLIESGNPSGALVVLARAANPGGEGFDAGDARLPITEALALNRLSDYKRQLEAARRGLAIAHAANANLLAAKARHFEATALASLGQPADAKAAHEEALATYLAAGDQYSAAQEQRALAALLRAQGDLPGAERIATEALKVCRAIGAQAEAARVLNTLSNVYYQQGRIAEAAKGYEVNLATFREIGDRNGEGAMLGNIGNARFSLGDPAGAIAAHEQALVVKRQEGSKTGIATSLIGLATAQMARGELPAATEHLTEALALTRESANKSLTAWALFMLGDGALNRGDLAEARRRHAEAFQIRTQLGENGAIAESRAALAVLDLEAGKLVEAQAALTAAAATLEEEGDLDAESLARTSLARCLRLAGEPAAARTELARAAELAQRAKNRAYRLDADIERARLDATSGQKPAALERLRSVETEAKRWQFMGIELESRLARAELGGASELAAVATEAEAKGYGLIAAKARAAAHPVVATSSRPRSDARGAAIFFRSR
ncbi:MAG: protein kinase [Acidobacteriota bacterium]